MKLTPINPHFNACDQKWELMPEQDGGRLCDTCERVLIDFTPYTEQEVLNQQRANDFKICGRYTREQVDRLHRHLTLEETQNNRPWLVSLAMGLGSLLPLGVAAQDNVIKLEDISLSVDSSTYQTVSVVSGSLFPKSIENEYATIDTVKIPTTHTVPMPGAPGNIQYPLLDVTHVKSEMTEINGTVKDAETDEPLPFATVLIEGTQTGVTTDFDGNFSLKVPSRQGSVTLITSYVGFQRDTTKVNLDINNNAGENLVNIKVKMESHVMGLTVVVSSTYVKPTVGNKLKRWSNPANWYRRIRNKIRYR